MAGKITARFGADISEFEAKAMQAKRVADYLSRAADGITGKARAAGGAMGEISKKFTGGKILESVLGGVGLGSGFGVAQKASELIASYWEKAAESAQKIADFSGQAVDSFVARMDLRRTDEQRLALAKKQLQSLEEQEQLAAQIAATSYASDAQKERAAKTAADAEKKRLEVAQMEKRATEKKQQAKDQERRELQSLRDANAKALADELEETKGIEYVRRRIAELERDAIDSRIPEKEQIKAAAELFAFRKKLRDFDAKQKEEASKAQKDETDKKAAQDKKAADKEAAAAEELAKMKEEARFSALSDEQKLADLQERGRSAFAKASKSGLSSDKLEVEKLRKEYEDLKKAIIEARKAQGSDDSKYSKIGLTRDEKGKLRRGRTIISEEDAKRTLATREKAERDAAKTGSGRSEEANLLKKIEEHLKPKKL